MLKTLSEPWTIIIYGKSWESDLQIDPAAAGVEAARAQLIGCSVERPHRTFDVKSPVLSEYRRLSIGIGRRGGRSNSVGAVGVSKVKGQVRSPL
jgi:hypothetical protein